jgi:hypothetical protein
VSPRVPLAIAMVVALGAGLLWLQGRFDGTDVRTGIARALKYRPDPAGPAVIDALAALGQGDPRCDGEIVSRLFGDVRVSCSNPGRPDVLYTFRVLLDRKRPPKGESPAAQRLLDELGRGHAASGVPAAR